MILWCVRARGHARTHAHTFPAALTTERAQEPNTTQGQVCPTAYPAFETPTSPKGNQKKWLVSGLGQGKAR